MMELILIYIKTKLVLVISIMKVLYYKTGLKTKNVKPSDVQDNLKTLLWHIEESKIKQWLY